MSIFISLIKFILTNFSLNTYLLSCNTLIAIITSWGYFILSYKFLLIIYTTVNTNLIVFGLQNQLAVIHPIIILLIYSFWFKGFLFLKKKSFNFRYSIYLSYITLFLGGLWAFQEFNWGGWWNWDGIETPIYLYTLFITFVYLHLLIFKKFTKLFFWLSNRYFYIFLLCIILLSRFGNINSIHSFINTSNNYLHYYSVYLICTFIYVLYIYWIKSFSIWTFFLLKIISLYLLVILFYYVCLLVKFKKYNIYHKLIYFIIIILFFINIKLFNIFFDEFLEHKFIVDVYQIWINKSFIFWTKPRTFFFQNEFIVLKYFLN